MMFTYCPSCGQKDTVKKLDATNYECTICKWHFWNNAKTAVTLVLVKNGMALTGKRGIEPRKGMCDFPGGFVDFGESAYDAAIREAHEELGITIDKKDLKLIEAYYNDYNVDVFTIDLIFVVHQWQGEPIAADDIEALEWKPFDFVKDATFAQKHYEGIDILLKSQKG